MGQVRGEKIIQVLEHAICQLAAKAAKKGEKYVFNASELQRVTGISRVTIGKQEDAIDEVLERVRATSRVRYGQANQQALYDRIENQEKKIKKLLKEAEVMRNHHAEIYKRLYTASIDMAGLVKKTVLDESVQHGKCILCNGKVDKNICKLKNNVVPLNTGTKNRKR